MKHFNFRSFVAATAFVAGVFGFAAGAIGDASFSKPYVVRGNTHMIVGVTLDEAAVRAALPAGLEPAEGITGGLNIYRSGGGYDHPAYTRAYVWVDLAGFDSASGAKGRYVLWGVTGPGAKGAQAEGLNLVDGSSVIDESGNTVVGTAMHKGAEIMRIELTLSEEPCGEASGTLNYPVVLPASGEKAMHQYPFATNFCGATPANVNISVGASHPLDKFRPASVNWAALARDLSFAGIMVRRD
jgi:hypothetical protein